MNLSVPDALHNLQITGKPSPAALDMIKLAALLAMLIDHINTVFLTPAQPLMYALGRMAFPLFTLIWAMNVQRSPERLQMRANRLWVWAVITQPVFSLAFQHHQPWWAMNILFVFAGVTQLLALQHRYGKKGSLAGGLLLALMIFPLQPASYGLAGITLAVSLTIVMGGSTLEMRRTAAFVAVLSLLCLNGVKYLLSIPAETLLLATLPTLVFPLIAVSLCLDLCPEGRQRFMPRNFFYYAYAGHLGIIGLIGVSLDIENYCTIRTSPACQSRYLWFLSALQ